MKKVNKAFLMSEW